MENICKISATGATVNSAADAHIPTTKETMVKNNGESSFFLVISKYFCNALTVWFNPGTIYREEWWSSERKQNNEGRNGDNEDEFNNEMERLEEENAVLKERLKREESQKGILEKEVRERENELTGVRNELTKLKGEMFKCLGECWIYDTRISRDNYIGSKTETTNIFNVFDNIHMEKPRWNCKSSCSYYYYY